jgi:steroid delta-isomerase-like uncharacterized protein
VATQQKAVPAAMDVAQAYFDACNRRDVDAMEACWAPGGLESFPGVGELTVPEQWRPYFEAVFASFPDWRYEVLHTVHQGDHVAVHWRAHATFTGAPFEGLRPSGESGFVSGIDLLQIVDGKIRRNDVYYDSAEMLRKLGVLPQAGSRGERLVKGLYNARVRAAGAFRKHRSG